jgi:hypothetical protein
MWKRVFRLFLSHSINFGHLVKFSEPSKTMIMMLLPFNTCLFVLLVVASVGADNMLTAYRKCKQSRSNGARPVFPRRYRCVTMNSQCLGLPNLSTKKNARSHWRLLWFTSLKQTQLKLRHGIRRELRRRCPLGVQRRRQLGSQRRHPRRLRPPCRPVLVPPYRPVLVPPRRPAHVQRRPQRNNTYTYTGWLSFKWQLWLKRCVILVCRCV